MSRPANADIKRHLQASFPTVKFSVRSGRGTGSSWTHIGWTDGPTDRRVNETLAAFGVVSGHMDNTDYFEGERISTSRHVSDVHLELVARALLAPKVVPTRDLWDRDIRLPNCGGYTSLQLLAWRAAGNREDFDRCRFQAHVWLDAVTLGRTEGARSTCYDRLATAGEV